MANENFTFQTGTKLKIGNEVIVLTKPSTLYFEGAGNEPKLAGLLILSDNMEANAMELACQYNAFGTPLVEPEKDKGLTGVNSMLGATGLFQGTADRTINSQLVGTPLVETETVKKPKAKKAKKDK